MDAIPALLKILNDSSKEDKALKEAAADGVRALMMGELRGEGMEEAAEARARALPLLIEVSEVSSLRAVKKQLAPVVEAFLSVQQ